jgi:uncharacterized protein (DUF1800 family)
MFDRKRFVTLPAAVVLACGAGAQAQITQAAAARFLEQASWGATPTTIAQVQQMGFSGYIDDQFLAPMSPIPDVPPGPNGREPVGPVQQQFFLNASTGADQLRQRVAFALSQIWVVSAVKLNTADQIVPYFRLLQQDAFENYSKIIDDVTLSPSMGHYLDMVNNDKPAAGREANENYARELLQLFTIGLNELNDDGSLQINSGQPIPTYGQNVVQGFARVFTGWTYAPMPGAQLRTHNPPYFAVPMVAVNSNHDTGSKTLLDGLVLPGGASRTALLDLTDALADIFNHHNVAPFISRQLIQHLVTSNPSPAYVSRVVAAWRSSGGDMRVVIKAILLDPEARAGDTGKPVPGFGHLREPVLLINTLLRELNATVSANNALASQGNNMGQNVYYAPSVFNYFSPGYRYLTHIPNQVQVSINAPEFQIDSTSTALTRANFANTLIYGTITGVTLDLTPYLNLTPVQLLDTLNQELMHGTLSPQAQTAILNAVHAQTTPKAKVQAAIYLIASSSQYQVER